jgi:hypothetical protein
MKIILKALGIFTTISLIVYGFLSFIIWNGNVGTWSMDSRFFMAITIVIFGGGATSAYLINKLDN